MEEDWTGITIANGQCDHPDCPWCAKIFLSWLKARMAQMSMPHKKMGETVSFATAAATSNVPGKDQK
jgi:hypothetical protein